MCGERQRVNCVVDGDPIRFQRKKIRIADIDTPEFSPPECGAERFPTKQPSTVFSLS